MREFRGGDARLGVLASGAGAELVAEVLAWSASSARPVADADDRSIGGLVVPGDITAHQLGGVVSAVSATVPVFVVHEPADRQAAWRIFRGGAVPWTGGHKVPDLTCEGHDAADAALRALVLEADGRSASAAQALWPVADPSDCGQAVDALEAVGAGVLEQLRRRARFLVSVDLLEGQLIQEVGIVEGDAYGQWWRSVERMAFRAAGLQLPPQPDGSPPAMQLFGALHGAVSLLRFTARRQWRPLAPFVQDVVDGARARSGHGVVTRPLDLAL